jgi:uncharacterized protein
MRIAIDIDSTLHHYWDVLSEISLRRFGVELPYEEQFTWGVTRLRADQFQLCVQESHSHEQILAGRPYPGAVETVREWSEAGHFIQVSSHRDVACAEVTGQWLRSVGLPYDDLCCSHHKVERCVELGIDLLIDDSPANITAAIDAGIATATLAHPWNRDVCEVEDVLVATDWPELACLLAPVLSEPPRRLAQGPPRQLAGRR